VYVLIEKSGVVWAIIGVAKKDRSRAANIVRNIIFDFIDTIITLMRVGVKLSLCIFKPSP